MPENQQEEKSVFQPLRPLLPKSLFEALPNLLSVFALLIAFVFLDRWYRSLTEINLDHFNEIMLATSPTQFFNGSWLSFTPVILVFGLIIWQRRKFLAPWKTIQGGSKLRWLVGTCIIGISWSHTTFPFNYFLFESPVVERSIILILTVLTIWRPFFLLPYLLFPVMVHFGEPLMVNNWSVTELPMRILMLFATQLLIWLLLPKSKWKIGAFFFLFFCVIAGNYFPAGISKIKMGWIDNDQLYLLLTNFYADGWVNIFSESTISKITQFLSEYNLLLKLGCLVFEFGCILILIRKRWSILFFLIGFLIFHTLVFAMTGIFFWPWMAFEIVLLIMIWRKDVFNSIINKFSIWHVLISMCLIFTSTTWLQPSVYAWHDSPVNYTYYFKVEDIKGKTFDLPVQYFWPKHYQQAWTNGFHFIHDQPTLNIVWGVSFDGEEIKRLLTFKNAEEVIAYEKAHGKSRLKPELANEFKRYMIDFVKNEDYKLTMNPLFRIISAPPQRLVFPADNTYNGEYEIVKIDIYQRLSIYNGEVYKELRKQKVLTIDIP